MQKHSHRPFYVKQLARCPNCGWEGNRNIVNLTKPCPKKCDVPCIGVRPVGL